MLCFVISPVNDWQSDNGDGTFTNPPLYADSPDPDIVRVGDDFYFATATFVNVPGLPILYSKDLVNWEYVSHVIHRPEQIDYRGRRISGGLFAPVISFTFPDGLFLGVTVGLHGRIDNQLLSLLDKI